MLGVLVRAGPIGPLVIVFLLRPQPSLILSNQRDFLFFIGGVSNQKDNRQNNFQHDH